METATSETCEEDACGNGYHTPLVWHDEGAANIAIFYKAFTIRKSQLGTYLYCCWPRSIRNWHNAVNVPPHAPAAQYNSSSLCLLTDHHCCNC